MALLQPVLAALISNFSSSPAPCAKRPSIPVPPQEHQAGGHLTPALTGAGGWGPTRSALPACPCLCRGPCPAPTPARGPCRCAPCPCLYPLRAGHNGQKSPGCCLPPTPRNCRRPCHGRRHGPCHGRHTGRRCCARCPSPCHGHCHGRWSYGTCTDRVLMQAWHLSSAARPDMADCHGHPDPGPHHGPCPCPCHGRWLRRRPPRAHDRERARGAQPVTREPPSSRRLGARQQQVGRMISQY